MRASSSMRQPQHVPVRTTDDDDDENDVGVDIDSMRSPHHHHHHREATHRHRDSESQRRDGLRAGIADRENGGETSADGLLLVSNGHHSGSSSSDSSGSSGNAKPTISNVPSLTVAFSAAATTGGTSYAFGLYAAALKRELRLSQGELDSIGTAFFVAGLFSWLPGWLSDRCGTRFALTLGGVTGATSLLLYWLVARQLLGTWFSIPHGSLVGVLSGLGVVTFLSCAMVTGAVFKIIVATAGPGLKGRAVGAAKGYVGLGAGLYACVFQALRGPRTSDLDFLPMAAVLFLGCATLPGWLLLPAQATLDRCAVRNDATGNHVRVLYLSLSALAALIVLNSMLNLYESGSSGSGSVVTTGAVRENSGEDANGDNETGSDLVATAEHELLLSENSLGAAPAGHHRKSNVWLGGLLLAIWLVPIATLLVLPREQRPAWDDGGVVLLPDRDDGDENDGDDDADNNNNESNHSERDDIDTREGGGRGDDESGTTSRGSRICKRRRSIRSGVSSDEENPLATSQSRKEDAEVMDGEEERGLLARDSERSQHGQRISVSPTRSSASASSPPRTNDSERSSSSSSSSEQPQPADAEINLNLFEMLQTRPALLMLWTTTVLVGAGTVMTNNLGQMVESLGFPAAVTSASMALFSVAQAAGRVLTGSLSEAALNWNTRRFGIDNGVPRPFWLLVASLVGFLAHLILGWAESKVVFVLGATLSGLAFGCVWPLMVLITGEVFGTANVGANYMFFDGTTSAAGTLLLTKVIAQDVYERHIGPDAPDEYTCLGTGCFQNTHLAVAALSLTCVVTSFGVLYTSRHVYNKVSLHVA